MTLAAFFGQVFLLGAPTAAVFCLVCTTDPRLVLFTIGGAFWWALSALIASTWWYIVAPMQQYPAFGIGFAVAFQELFRWGFVALVSFVLPFLFHCPSSLCVFTPFFVCPHFRWFEKRVNMLTGKKELPSMVLLGLASGVGTAAMYACVEIVPVLIEGMGPATVFSRACPHTSLFTLASVTGLVFTLLHMIWSVFGFLLYAHRALVVAPVLVLSHFGASYFVCSSSWHASHASFLTCFTSSPFCRHS